MLSNRTFPTTAYQDYDPTYSLCGTVATSINGSATCLTYQDGCDITTGVTRINDRALTSTYPSHPLLLQAGIQTRGMENFTQDPRGWTYVPVIGVVCGDEEELLKPLFPDLGLWSCAVAGGCVLGATYHDTALLLTATSISTEDGAPIPSEAGPSLSSPEKVEVTDRPSVMRPEAMPASTTSTRQSEEVSVVASEPPRPISPLMPVVATAPSTGLTNAQGSTGVSLVQATSTAPPALTIGSQTVTANPQNEYVIGSRTLRPGSEITVSGTPISLDSGATEAIVGTRTQRLTSNVLPAVTSPPALTIGTQTILPDAQGNYVIASQTLTPGGAVTVSGTPVSLAPGGGHAIVGTSTANLAILPFPQLATATPPPLTMGSQTLTANAQGQYVVDGQTLHRGGAITVSGTPISLAPGGAYAVIGSSTEVLAITTPPPALTIGTRVVTANAQGQYIVDGQTLTPGGGISVSGTPISLAAGGAYAVIGSSTENLAITPRPALTVGTQVVTANIQGQYIIDGQTLTRAGVITISGTQVSLAPNGAFAVVGTSTENLAATSPSALTIGTQPITPNAFGQYTIDGQTLTRGGVVTVSGTPISLAPGGEYAVVGTSAENLLATVSSGETAMATGSTTTTDGLGNVIMNGFGNNATAPAEFTGIAAARIPSIAICFCGMLLAVSTIVLMCL